MHQTVMKSTPVNHTAQCAFLQSPDTQQTALWSDIRKLHHPRPLHNKDANIPAKSPMTIILEQTALHPVGFDLASDFESCLESDLESHLEFH